MLYLPAGRAEAILICPNAVPAETADLVTTGAREKVDIVYLERFHAQRALHGVFFQLGTTGHPIALVQGVSDHSSSPEQELGQEISGTKQKRFRNIMGKNVPF